MKTMLEYIEEAGDLISAVWGDASAKELRAYLKKHLPDWSEEEHEELLTLAATLAHWQAEGARDANWEASRRGREIEEIAVRTSKGLRRFRVREADKREAERRAAIIQKHFGAALRGEAPDTDGDAA